MRGGRQLLGGFALTAVVVAVGAGVVIAGGGYKTKAKSVTLKAGDDSRVRARACPGNGEDVGSGFDVGAYDPAGAGPRGVLTAALEGFASAVNTGGTAGELTAERYCSGRHSGMRRPSANVQLAPGESGKAARSCDRRFRAITAGFESRMKDLDEANLDELRVRSAFIKSRRKRQRGIVAADNTSATKQFRLYVYVTCYRRGPGLKLRSASTAVAAGAVETATARCPRRRRAIGGGFKAGEGTHALSGLVAGKRRWRVRAAHEGTGTGKLTAIAHCVRRG